MNKIDLIDELSRKAGIHKPDAKMVVQTFFDSMATSMAKGGRVEVWGLLSFYVKKLQGIFRPESENRPKSHG